MSSNGQTNSSGGIAVSVRGLSKSYTIRRKTPKHSTLGDALVDRLRRPFRRSTKEIFWALKDVSFDIKKGEVVGIIGRNGAGKSTLLKILSRITPPTTGEVDLYGRVGSLLEVGTGFHGELTGRENIFLNGAILGMSRSEIRRQFDAIVDFAEIERFLDTPVKRYSSGMYVRLAFAVAAHLNSDILIVDEVLAVGDASFQRRCLGKMEEVSAQGRAVLFVSHSMPTVLRLCTRVILLGDGRVESNGTPAQIIRAYLSTGTNTPAERVWKQLTEAPGDSVARLLAVRVLGPDGGVEEAVRIDRGCYIEIEYWSGTSELRPSAAFHLVNEAGTVVFASGEFTGEDWHDAQQRSGLVRARCRIPAHLLAEGRFSVLAAVCTFDPNVVHAVEQDAVTFQAVDSDENSLVRRLYSGAWPGDVRPLLQWTSVVEHPNPCALRGMPESPLATG